LRAAMSRIRSETRTVAELSLESKRLDLLSFSAVGNLAVLRERLSGPTMHPSVGDSGLVTRSDRSSAKPGSTASSERAAG
jgi:hypothetical protein